MKNRRRRCILHLTVPERNTSGCCWLTWEVSACLPIDTLTSQGCILRVQVEWETTGDELALAEQGEMHRIAPAAAGQQVFSHAGKQIADRVGAAVHSEKVIEQAGRRAGMRVGRTPNRRSRRAARSKHAAHETLVFWPSGSGLCAAGGGGEEWRNELGGDGQGRRDEGTDQHECDRPQEGRGGARAGGGQGCDGGQAAEARRRGWCAPPCGPKIPGAVPRPE